MKYINLSYLINNLKFNDKILFSNDKTYEVEQVHNGFHLDLYDKDYNLHTFDLRRLFIFDKILKVNEEIIPVYKHESKDIVDDNYIWLPLSFEKAIEVVSDERVYASLYALSSKASELSKANWIKDHYIELFDKPNNEAFINLRDKYNDDVLIILFNKTLLLEQQSKFENNKAYIYQYIDLTYIDKIYFMSQVSIDKFLARIRHLQLHNFIKSKCVYDPYLLDESLQGKW